MAAGKKLKPKKAGPKRGAVRGRGRPPLVENHPRRDEILAAVMVPKPNYSAISREFGISDDSLRTFRKANITEPTRRALDEIAQVQAELPVAALDVMSKLSILVDRGFRLVDAMDEHLADPDQPGKYLFAPRAGEITVVYEEEVPAEPGKEPRWRRRTAKLSMLLERVTKELGVNVLSWEAKTADSRELLYKAMHALKPVLELIGKNTGQLRADPTIEIHLHPEVVDLRNRLAEWLLAKHPAEVEELARLFEASKP